MAANRVNMNSSDAYIDIPLTKHAGPSDDQYGLWDFVPPEEMHNPEIVPSRKNYYNFEDETSEMIRRLVDMTNEDRWSFTRNKSFYQQAKFMENFKDDSEIVDFSSYYPTYQDMNVAQMRSYFTIRKMLRLGLHPEVPVSYLFVYVYELLMNVGVKTPEEGYELLEELFESYRISEPRISVYLKYWICDYIVYYNLADKCGEFFNKVIQSDMDISALADYRNIDDTLFFGVLMRISTYNIEKSKAYGKMPEDYRKILVRVMRHAIPVIESREHKKIVNVCFGSRQRVSCTMFSGAVFYNPDPPMQRIFEVSPVRYYYCHNGLWSVERFQERNIRRNEDKLGMSINETDRRIRLKFHSGSKTLKRIDDEEIESLIQNVIDEYVLEKEEAARPKIEIDLSKLDTIRSDADVVRDAMLTDDDKIETQNVMSDYDTISDKGLSSVDTVSDTVLDEDETAFMHLLLNGGNWKSFLREKHIPEGVMIDGINEKLMDEFQDTVIVDEGNGPEILEDYKDEIIGIL